MSLMSRLAAQAKGEGSAAQGGSSAAVSGRSGSAAQSGNLAADSERSGSVGAMRNDGGFVGAAHNGSNVARNGSDEVRGGTSATEHAGVNDTMRSEHLEKELAAGYFANQNVSDIQSALPLKQDKPRGTDKTKDRVHREVVSVLARREDQGQEVNIDQLIEEVMDDSAEEISRKDRSRIHRDVLNEVIGLGPLEELLNDPTISEIMVNGPRRVYVERSGKLMLSDVVFDDDAHVRRIIDRIVSPLGRHIDDSNPMVDARLADGSRVNAVIPPIALCGPSLTIRKFSATPLTVDNLIGFGSMTPMMADFLEAAVMGKLNILVSGGTGSGKTTLLNVLSAFIPATERIVTIEDAAELRLMQDHVVPMESRPANLEGTGAITIRDLVRNALRMRPDRIIVGEVRGGETLDMLQAMNTGHDGSLTTAHANSPRDALARIETMTMMAGMDLPATAIRSQIAGALDLIVQQARLRDGSRKVTSICEVLGMEGDIITTQEIFRFINHGYGEDGRINGEFVSCGIRPQCAQKMQDNGAVLQNEWFFDPREAL